MSFKMMDDSNREALIELTGGAVRFDRPMAPLTTLGVGGNAEVFYEAFSLDELRKVLDYARRARLPCMTIGKGSNILVSDKGIAGLVIRLGGQLARISLTEETAGPLLCGAGASIGELTRFCGEKGLCGLEFLAGIPGSIGGAVFMNAGAFGSEICEAVSSVTVITPRGEIRDLEKKDLSFSYRRLELEKNTVIVEAVFLVSREKSEDVRDRIAGFLKKRKNTQPMDFPSAGSVFKNPGTDYAGRLIEQVGLKGARKGGAMISSRHANWIVNTGGARAEDILWLIDLARRRVSEIKGIELELELCLAGEGLP